MDREKLLAIDIFYNPEKEDVELELRYGPDGKEQPLAVDNPKFCFVMVDRVGSSSVDVRSAVSRCDRTPSDFDLAVTLLKTCPQLMSTLEMLNDNAPPDLEGADLMGRIKALIENYNQPKPS